MQPDSLLNARYRVIYAVDERPTGVTLRARDEQSGGVVLLGAVPVSAATSASVALLARQISAIKHELLLPLIDHFAIDGQYILVCTDPGGHDVERLVRANGTSQPEQETLAHATKLLQLLDTLHHNKPPLHFGDLWLGDVLITQAVWHLTPFPLARMVSPTPTPYRAPELANTSVEPTNATDTFAIAALLYSALCGATPPTPEQQEAGIPLVAPRTLNPALSPLLEQTLLRGLQLKQANRYQNARELRLALETVHLMAGRSLGLGPDILKSPEIIAATAEASGTPPEVPRAKAQSDRVTQELKLPVDVPIEPPTAVVAAAEAPVASQYVYDPLPEPAAPPRKGLSTGCMVGLALGLGALVVALAVALLVVLTLNGTFGSLLNQNRQPNGNRVATATSGPHAITIANVNTITSTATITSAMFGPIAYAPTSNQVAIGIGSSVRLADADLREQRLLSGHNGAIVTIAFSPDGTLLASAAQDDTAARIWNVASGTLLQTLNGHTGWLRSVAFSPDGTLLATGSVDATVKLWNVQTGRLVATLSGHTGWVGVVAFSPDGKTIAASSRDGTVLAWNVADATPLDSFSYKNQINPQTNQPYFTSGMVFSPDGKRLAVGGFDGSIALLNAADGTLVRRLTGHEGYIVLRGLAISPDGKTLYSASSDGSVRAWSMDSGSELGQFAGHNLIVVGLALSPDGTQLASISAEEGSIIVWNTASRTSINRLQSDQGLITTLQYTADSSTLGMTNYGGALRMRLNNGQQSVVGQAGSALSAAFLADAQLAIRSDQDEIRLVRARDGTNQLLSGLDGKPRSLVSNRAGTLLAAGSATGHATVWDDQGKLRATITSQFPAVQTLAISDDGRWLAIGGFGERSQIELWQIDASPRLSQTLAGPRDGVASLTFGPNSNRLAATDLAGEFFLWDVATAKLLTLKQANDDQRRYTALAFSPDGTLLVGGALNGEIVAWNGDDGSDIGSVPISYGGVITLAFSPDGQQIAASVRDEEASVYILQPR